MSYTQPRLPQQLQQCQANEASLHMHDTGWVEELAECSHCSSRTGEGCFKRENAVNMQPHQNDGSTILPSSDMVGCFKQGITPSNAANHVALRSGSAPIEQYGTDRVIWQRSPDSVQVEPPAHFVRKSRQAVSHTLLAFLETRIFYLGR